MEFLLLTLALLVGSALLIVVRRPPVVAAQALLFLAAAAYLTYYVASEDDYRRNGITRWEAYDAKGLTVAAVAACLAVGIGALVGLLRRGFLTFAAFAGLAAAGLFVAAFIANSTN